MRTKVLPVVFILAALALAGCGEGMEGDNGQEAEDSANVLPRTGTVTVH